MLPWKWIMISIKRIIFKITFLQKLAKRQVAIKQIFCWLKFPKTLPREQSLRRVSIQVQEKFGLKMKMLQHWNLTKIWKTNLMWFISLEHMNIVIQTQLVSAGRKIDMFINIPKHHKTLGNQTYRNQSRKVSNFFEKILSQLKIVY